jgi:hypothetical protein
MTFAGTLEPTEPIGAPVENGGKLWWAVLDSNQRPFRCKRWLPQQSCADYGAFAHRSALFGSVYVRGGGSKRTGRTSKILPALAAPSASANLHTPKVWRRSWQK